jgi:dienelactone hydrolase
MEDLDEEGKIIYVFHPQLSGAGAPYPVIVFSHGSTGEWLMYQHAFERYVSHGFVVLFPHIKSPEQDINALTTDPMGGFTTKGVHFASAANTNASSPLYGKLDTSNIVLAGHSMGASSTIMAAANLPAGTAKLAYAQHPGLCGPIGPPPCIIHGSALCYTWLDVDFQAVSSKMPIIMHTAANDKAFDIPLITKTPKKELECFHTATDNSDSKDSTIFARFSEDVCQDDGQGGRDGRTWSNGGHDCPMLNNSPETAWVLTAAKLYAQLDGDVNSHCHAMLWGNGQDSLQQDSAVDEKIVNVPSLANVTLV